VWAFGGKRHNVMEKEIKRHLATVLKPFNNHKKGDEIFLKDSNFKDLETLGLVEVKEKHFPQLKKPTRTRKAK
jgi:hypothetical protein